MKSQRTIKKFVIGKWLTLGFLASALCGCLGGSISQQLVQSVLLHGADKVTSAALDANEAKQMLEAQNITLKNTTPDKFDIAFINSGFEEVTAQIEPLPQTAPDEEMPVQLMQETKLIQVEVWSLLVGDEKQNILENAKKLGSTEVPPENEWEQSLIAVGGATNNNNGNKQEVITFLIPAEMGKLHSGSKALVELPRVGPLSIARYTVNN